MKHLVSLLLVFSFALPAVAGDPGDDFWALVQIRKANSKIDDATSDVSAALRADKITAGRAESRWKELHGQALQLKSQSIALESGEVPNVAKAMTKMMRLEIQRLEGLIKASQIEQKSGRAVARPFWAKQLILLQDYQQQEALVLDMMNWIEENP